VQEKIAAMAEKTRQKVIADKQKKQADWKKVQVEGPDIALLLTQLGGAFDKLAKVEVVIHKTGEEIKIR